MSAAVIGVIQARMGSTRLPGKALLDLAGRPLLWHMADRMRRVGGVGEIVLATTEDPRNDALVAFAEREGLAWCRHPEEDDLAGRIALAIHGRTGDVILKTGGDCPLIDPAVLQRIVDRACEPDRPDFVSNRVAWSYPLGLSADAVSRHAIEWCDANLTTPEDREFFAIYVRDHPERFKVVPVINETDLSHHGWTVDEPEDLTFVREVFAALYREGGCFGLNDVLAFLDRRAAE